MTQADMNMGLTSTMLSLIVFCILTETAREVCFKHAAAEGDFLAVCLKPVTWAGIVFWAVELIGWTIVLQNVALSIAFPLMSLSYVVIVVAGALIFNETIDKRRVTGVFLITAGVACVGATGL
jgi:undecaprenyl phosphate-alpha-L-ara4N flippase subunit ArnE